MPELSRASPSFVTVHGTQVVFIDGCANSPAQALAAHLVESKVDSAVDSRIGDVVGDLLELGVVVGGTTAERRERELKRLRILRTRFSWMSANRKRRLLITSVIQEQPRGLNNSVALVLSRRISGSLRIVTERAEQFHDG